MSGRPEDRTTGRLRRRSRRRRPRRWDNGRTRIRGGASKVDPEVARERLDVCGKRGSSELPPRGRASQARTKTKIDAMGADSPISEGPSKLAGLIRDSSEPAASVSGRSFELPSLSGRSRASRVKQLMATPAISATPPLDAAHMLTIKRRSTPASSPLADYACAPVLLRKPSGLSRGIAFQSTPVKCGRPWPLRLQKDTPDIGVQVPLVRKQPNRWCSGLCQMRWQASQIPLHTWGFRACCCHCCQNGCGGSRCTRCRANLG